MYIFFFQATHQQLESSEFIQDLEKIVSFLSNRLEELVLLTPPPVPRLGYRGHSLRVWRDLCSSIRQLGKVDNITAVDITKFFWKRNSFLQDKYEQYYPDGKSPDGIHWNNKGIDQVLDFLEKCLA